jgi:RNA 3'-terminal phosphate cyclase (ATP)
MLPLALAVVARGGSASFTCTEVTEYATTNLGVIEKFLPMKSSVETNCACSRVQLIAATDT